MKAVILAGGSGTRLRPLTHHLPKPMVPVVNRPHLARIIDHLKSHQIFDIVLTTSYLPEMIRKWFGDGSASGVRLQYSWEETPLGTAGAVRQVLDLVNDEPFVVYSGDILTDLDLTAMCRAHKRRRARVSIGLASVADPTGFGIVTIGTTHRIHSFVEKPSAITIDAMHFINTGIYIVDPAVIRPLQTQTPAMFEHDVFPRLVAQGAPVYGYPAPAGTYWTDLGTPQRYLAAHAALLDGQMRGPAAAPCNRDRSTEQVARAEMQIVEAPVSAQQIILGSHVEIAPTARLTGPLVIGDECYVGPHVCLIGPTTLGSACRIQAGATIESSVLWSGVRVGERSTVRQCILGQDVLVGDNVTLSGDVVAAQGSA